MSFFSSQFPIRLFQKTSKESAVLYISMFVMGACGLAYEYTLSKVASDILGNSVRQWAIIIGVMMFFMGVGSDVQKYLKNSNLVDKFIFFEILIGLLGAFGPIALLYSYSTFQSHYILVQYFFISGIGLIIGFEIPLITRINETYTRELKINLGSVLKMDYIGSLAGSLLWIFLLPRFFTTIESAFVLGVFNLLVALFTLLFFSRLVLHKKALFVLSVLSLAAVSFGGLSAKGWTSHSEQKLYRDRIIFSETTRFQHIVLTQSRSKSISCYINGHLQFNSVDEFIYHEHLVHPVFVLAAAHKDVLILGGGDGLALREVLKYSDVEAVTVCDIDPVMTTLARENSIFQNLNDGSLAHSKVTILENHALVDAGKTMLQVENQKNSVRQVFDDVAEINIINLDAAAFVEQISGLYDIIIIDFPDPNNQDLSKLYSDLFYHHVRKKLKADGVFVQQSTSPVHAKDVFLLIGRTISASGLSAIPFHDNVPSFGEWGWWIGGRSERYNAETIETRLRNTERFDISTRYLTPALLKASLTFGKNQLNTDDLEINTLTNGLAFTYYVKAWQF
jgi:spermidine synthase